MRGMLEAVAWVILLTIMQIVEAGCLWVLRVVIDWWLDIDYVKKIKEWLGWLIMVNMRNACLKKWHWPQDLKLLILLIIIFLIHRMYLYQYMIQH